MLILRPQISVLMKNGRLEILNVFDVVGISAELACLVISDVLGLGNSAPGSPLGRKPTTGRSANLEAGGYPVVSGMGFHLLSCQISSAVRST
jgi:hypothetical protein